MYTQSTKDKKTLKPTNIKILDVSANYIFNMQFQFHRKEHNKSGFTQIKIFILKKVLISMYQFNSDQRPKEKKKKKSTVELSI